MTRRMYRGPRRHCCHCRERASVEVDGQLLCYSHYNDLLQTTKVRGKVLR